MRMKGWEGKNIKSQGSKRMKTTILVRINCSALLDLSATRSQRPNDLLASDSAGAVSGPMCLERCTFGRREQRPSAMENKGVEARNGIQGLFSIRAALRGPATVDATRPNPLSKKKALALECRLANESTPWVRIPHHLPLLGWEHIRYDGVTQSASNCTTSTNGLKEHESPDQT